MAKKITYNKALLTPEDALSLLAPHKEGRKQRVHSFQGFSSVLMGCDIDLTQIKKRLKSATEICLSGRNMRGMGHGVAYHDGTAFTFLETDRVKIDEIRIKRKIKD